MYDPVIIEILNEALADSNLEYDIDHKLVLNCDDYRIWINTKHMNGSNIKILLSVFISGSKIEIGYGGAQIKDLICFNLADPDSLSQLPRALMAAFQVAYKNWGTSWRSGI